MKADKFESLLGGSHATHLTHDAMTGLNGLARRFADRTPEDVLFETAIRRANEEDLRKLARLRLDAATSRYLD